MLTLLPLRFMPILGITLGLLKLSILSFKMFSFNISNELTNNYNRVKLNNTFGNL